MPRGGKRPGAGRPKGSNITKTSELAVKAGTEGLTPVELLLGIVRDETQTLAFRAQCAGIVLPYVTPRLASVTIERKPNSELLERLFQQMKKDGKLVIDQKPIEAITALPAT
jgi:hypothetical protein